MKSKLKPCYGCGKNKVIWKNHQGNKYCQYCWSKIKFDTEPFKPKKYTPIKPKSSKQAASDKAYSLLRIPFLEQYPMCQVALPGCTGHSTDVHHKKGRGKWLLITGTWMAVCRTCHTWIELHPIEATELGFRESKIQD